MTSLKAPSPITAPSLAGESAAVPGLSPWECLEKARAEAVPGHLFLWETPSGEALAGVGAACELESHGSGRFGDIRLRLDLLLGSAVHRGASPSGFPGAIAVGGFAFAEQVGRRGWPGFADASFHVPARTFWQAPGSATIETRWTADGKGEPEGDRLEDAAGPDLEAAPDEIGERDRWMDAVGLTLERIRDGNFSKAVLARSRGIVLDRSADAAAIMASLRDAYPTSCYRYLIADGRGNAFLGASPERLVRLVSGEILTEAVAGTQRCEPGDDGSKLGRALAKSQKDLSEHRIVLDHLLATLAPLCESHSAAASPEVMRLPHLLHLRTRVRGLALPGAHVLELVSRLHPTPAVAGWPRSEALSWIGRVEECGRGWYAGPVGWVNARGEGDFTVGIRSIALRGRNARLFAGAGIVEGSDPALEWSETELKMKGILDAVARD